jgi:Ser-tRNA(Ala) deacylase AlaX
MSPRSLLRASSIRDMKPSDNVANEREEAAKRFNLNRLPDQAGEMVRIIRIGDHDACPCIGERVRRMKEIGVFQVYSTRYEGGVKVRFKLLDGSPAASSVGNVHERGYRICVLEGLE